MLNLLKYHTNAFGFARVAKKIFFLLTITAVVTLVACSNTKANDDGSVNNTETENSAANTMTCSINGQSFVSSQLFNAASTKFHFSLVGKSKDKTNAIELFFKRDETKTGAVFNYKFKMGEVPENSVRLRQYENSKDDAVSKMIGFSTSTITITKATANRIEGTFEANGKDNNITDGKFSIATALKW